MKHLIRNKHNTVQKLNSILKLHSPSSKSNRLITSQTQTPLKTNSQFSDKPVVSQSLHYRKKIRFAPQLSLSNSMVNPHLNIAFASQTPLQNTKSEFALNNLTTNNSHSNSKFAAKAMKSEKVKKVNNYAQ